MTQPGVPDNAVIVPFGPDKSETTTTVRMRNMDPAPQTQTQTAHTPGPWSVIEDPYVYRVGVVGEGIAKVARNGEFTGLEKPSAQANARLIAAAPDLLAACESALAYLESHRPKGSIRDNFSAYNEHENGAVNPLRAAIAKAQGKGV